MGVVALQRIVHEPKPGASASSSERALDLPHEWDGAQRREARSQPDGHVRRQPPKGAPRAVANAGMLVPLASGPGTTTAPRARRGQQIASTSTSTRPASYRTAATRGASPGIPAPASR
jgi:hypothetical protein